MTRSGGTGSPSAVSRISWRTRARSEPLMMNTVNPESARLGNSETMV